MQRKYRVCSCSLCKRLRTKKQIHFLVHFLSQCGRNTLVSGDSVALCISPPPPPAHKYHQNHLHSGLYEANKPNIFYKKWVSSYLCHSAECVYSFDTFDLDLGSFWVTVHASRVLMSAQQPTVYCGLTHLLSESKSFLLQMLASLARYDPVWVNLMIITYL